MPYEMRQFEFMRRRLLEEDLWFSAYNRDINGVIHNQEKHSNKPIPRGAGVRDILIAFGNYFEYSFMTIELIDMILSRIFEVRNDIDLSNKNIVLVKVVLRCSNSVLRMKLSEMVTLIS